ncbi:MAG: DUF411 domain-containing protein [Planctomycetota bacterium]
MREVGDAELVQIKSEHGVPQQLAGCHTGVVDGYVIEGHVPADVMGRLLRERPDVIGLSVPGMPVGSPGMEGPNPVPYDVLTFDEGGQTEVYERR